MDLSDVRQRLLEQHEHLRQRIARLLAYDPHASEGELDFRVELAELSDELARHNREEERLLGAIVPTIDAWGPVRKQLMDEHHAGQHAAQLGALRSIAEHKPFAGDLDGAVAYACEELRQILAHMEREERELLSPDVLRDDAYAVAMDTGVARGGD